VSLPIALKTLDELSEPIGRELAVSDWFTVTREARSPAASQEWIVLYYR
jgi:hypothetical protein